MKLLGRRRRRRCDTSSYICLCCLPWIVLPGYATSTACTAGFSADFRLGSSHFINKDRIQVSFGIQRITHHTCMVAAVVLLNIVFARSSSSMRCCLLSPSKEIIANRLSGSIAFFFSQSWDAFMVMTIFCPLHYLNVIRYIGWIVHFILPAATGVNGRENALDVLFKWFNNAAPFFFEPFYDTAAAMLVLAKRGWALCGIIVIEIAHAWAATKIFLSYPYRKSGYWFWWQPRVLLFTIYRTR